MKTTDFSDRELRAAAALVNSAMLEAVEASVVPHTYSDAFSQKMRPLFQRARKDEARRTARRRLIAALLALAIGASVFLAWNDTARAAVQKWLRTVRETVFTYQSEGDDAAKSVTGCVPHWLPEGYEPIDSIQESGFIILTYQNASSQKHFDICITSSSVTSVQEFGLSDGEYEIKKYAIGNAEADLLLSLDSEITSAIVWFDEEKDCSISIDGYLSEAELIQIADHLEITSS